MTECPFGNQRCKCATCSSNAAKESCNHGYCTTCFECMDKKTMMHDVYLCTGYEETNEG